jgi:hypothetical protein
MGMMFIAHRVQDFSRMLDIAFSLLLGELGWILRSMVSMKVAPREVAVGVEQQYKKNTVDETGVPYNLVKASEGQNN